MAKLFSNVNAKTWAIICVIIFAIIIFNYYTKKEGFDSNNKIPNVIWTFWDGEMPPLVKACIDSWKTHNPEYKIIVLNKQNVQEYLPEPDLSKMRHVNDFVQRYSDFVRIHILAKYGGIWLDSSVICQKPLSWIHDIQRETGVEYIGYFTDNMTLPEYREKSPVIENWAFACIPECLFMKDWRDQMASFSKYDKVLDYSNEVVRSGTNPQGIPGAPNNIEYFAMHLAAQRLLQKNREKYNLHLLCAEDTALVYLVEPGTRNIMYTEDSIRNNSKKIIDKKHSDQPILKLPGYIRETVEKMTDDFTDII
jgi:hypothetical protein